MAFLDIPVALSLGSEVLRDLVQARDYAGDAILHIRYALEAAKEPLAFSFS
jgi:hypothetical protein